MATFGDIQNRYQILKGDTTTTTADTTGKSHINWSVKDILNRHPFSFAQKQATVTNAADLPSDINKKFGITILDSDGNEFTEVPATSQYTADGNVYWIIAGKVYTPSTETLNIFYQYEPTDMSLTTDPCLIPDGECVAYLSASKNWIGDERNVELKKEYEAEAELRIKSLIQSDLMFGTQYTEGSLSEQVV